jgi:glycosyltransferase involved in cell wall biosynthesis
MTNILWLPSWYPSVHDPVYGCFIQKQAEAVCQYDAKIQIAVLYVLRANVEKLETEVLKKDNLLEIKLFYPQKAFFFGIKQIAYGWYYWKAYQKGMSILKQFDFKPTALHLHVVYGAGLYALWLKIWTGLPLFISEHWSGYEQGGYQKTSYLHRKIFQWCFQKASASICISNKMYQNLHKNGLSAKQTFIIPNVVDTILFSPIKHNAVKIKFIHVSNLDYKIKNVQGILRAVHKLAEKNQNFSLEIVGEGKERCLLETMVRETQLQNFVWFSGLLSTEKVAERLRQSDVFILFSHYEGLPCVILEAFASGLPVIATETGGINEWVTPETGILLKIGDENALLAAMETMISTYLKYDKTILRQPIIEKASYQAVGKALSDVYKSNCLK